jgi:hypothetical protein
MRYLVIYSVTDTYETYVEIDDNSPDPRADIEDYLNNKAWEEDLDRSWVGAGIILERAWPKADANA